MVRLMRHAEAGGTALDFWGALRHLSPEGRVGARAAAHQLYSQLVETPTVFAPNMIRHMQTAEIVCEIFGIKPVIDWRLGPFDPEAWDEMMMKVIKSGEKFPDSWLEYARDHNPDLVNKERHHLLDQIEKISREHPTDEILIMSSSGLIEPVVGRDHELNYCEVVNLR